MYEVRVGRKAEKVLNALPDEHFMRIREAIESLSSDTEPRGAERLASSFGARSYRIRVGQYRVLYSVEPDERRKLVFRIEKRSRVYK